MNFAKFSVSFTLMLLTCLDWTEQGSLSSVILGSALLPSLFRAKEVAKSDDTLQKVEDCYFNRYWNRTKEPPLDEQEQWCKLLTGPVHLQSHEMAKRIEMYQKQWCTLHWEASEEKRKMFLCQSFPRFPDYRQMCQDFPLWVAQSHTQREQRRGQLHYCLAHQDKPGGICPFVKQYYVTWHEIGYNATNCDGFQ